MKTHELKSWPKSFQRIKDGSKTFDVRNNDRDFQTGDILVLKEWDNEKKSVTREEDRFTGQTLKFKIGYVGPLALVPQISYAVQEVLLRDKMANLVVLSLLPVPV